MEFVKSAEKQILIDDLKINYKQIGDGNITIILLHGWGVSSDKYLETARQLMISASGGPAAGGQFSIVIPDLPGFGKSDKPLDVWGVDEYVEFVKKFIDRLLGNGVSKSDLETPFPSENRKIILIGHSFGGRIAIKFAAKYPEKLKALILTGAAGIKHPPTTKQEIFYALAKTGKVFFSLPLLNHLRKSAQKLLYKAAREKDYYYAQGVMKEVFKKIIAEDLTPYLGKIKTPTLLVWGAKDNSTPLADGKVMNLKIQNSKFKILDDANHQAPYQYPEEFAKIVLEFIKNINA